MAFTKLERLLNQSIYKAGLTHHIKTAEVLNQYTNAVEQLFGNAVARKMKPLYLKDKILTVACLSQELVTMVTGNQRAVLELINQPYDHKIVEQIRFLT